VVRAFSFLNQTGDTAMKRLMAVVSLLLMALVSPALAAEDPTGTWKFTAMLGKKSTDATLKLKLEGDKLTGTVGLAEGGRGETAISDGTFKDDKVSFTVTRELKGEKFTQKYSGTVSGDTIKGKIDSERGGKSRSSDWEAKRQK
jgi:hypothetical protein